MTTFTLSDQFNLARALRLEPSQYHPNSNLKFLMDEVEIDDSRYVGRNHVKLIQTYLYDWLRLDDETDPDNPIVKEREATLARLDIKRERIDGQYELEYDTSKLPTNYMSAISLKRLRIKQIQDLLDPLNKLHRYVIKSKAIAT